MRVRPRIAGRTRAAPEDQTLDLFNEWLIWSSGPLTSLLVARCEEFSPQERLHGYLGDIPPAEFENTHYPCLQHRQSAGWNQTK